MADDILKNILRELQFVILKRLMVKDKGASRAAQKELPEHLRAFFLRKADHSRFYRVLRDEMKIKELVGEDVDALSPEKNIVVKYIRETLKYDGPLDVSAEKYIKNAYRALANKYHPRLLDRLMSDPKQVEIAKKLHIDYKKVKEAAGIP